MDEIFRRKVCDICGREVYEKCTGESVLDGGFTIYNTFEDSGFHFINLPGFSLIMACPVCISETYSFLSNRHDTYVGGPLMASLEEKNDN